MAVDSILHTVTCHGANLALNFEIFFCTGDVDLASSVFFYVSVLRKRGKLISFLRTFFTSRPARTQLRRTGIVRERVFGCDLGEHLLNSEHSCNVFSFVVLIDY